MAISRFRHQPDLLKAGEIDFAMLVVCAATFLHSKHVDGDKAHWLAATFEAPGVSMSGATDVGPQQQCHL